MARLVVDTGFLVALYLRRDNLHDSAIRFLQTNRSVLLTVAPVIVETCYFLNVRGKVEFLKWLQRGGIHVTEIPSDAYPRLALLIEKYADLDIDLADAALIWFAELSEERRILTVDNHDFSSFRIKGRTRFDLVPWF